MARCSGLRVLTKGCESSSGSEEIAVQGCILQQDTDPCAVSATIRGIYCHGVGSPASSSCWWLRGFDGEPHQKKQPETLQDTCDFGDVQLVA